MLGLQMMGRCSKQAKIFLVSMVYEQQRTGMAETTFEKVLYVCSSFTNVYRWFTSDPYDPMCR
jgi:hypothetical protein